MLTTAWPHPGPDEPGELSNGDLASLVYRYGRCVSLASILTSGFPWPMAWYWREKRLPMRSPSVSHARYARSAWSIPCAMGPIPVPTECGAG